MTDGKGDFDWAAAALSVARCDSQDLRVLAKAASLSPEKGDLADADFSKLDLRGQDFSGWDLSYATFAGSQIARANFVGSKIDVELLTEAEDWEKAELDPIDRSDARFAAVCKIKISDLEISARLYHTLLKSGITTIRDIMQRSVEELIEIPTVGPSSLQALESSLKKFDVVITDYRKKNILTVTEVARSTGKLSTGKKFSYAVNRDEQSRVREFAGYSVSDEYDRPELTDVTEPLSVQEEIDRDNTR